MGENSTTAVKLENAEIETVANVMCQSIITWNKCYDYNHSKTDQCNVYVFC